MSSPPAMKRANTVSAPLRSRRYWYVAPRSAMRKGIPQRPFREKFPSDLPSSSNPLGKQDSRYMNIKWKYRRILYFDSKYPTAIISKTMVGYLVKLILSFFLGNYNRLLSEASVLNRLLKFMHEWLYRAKSLQSNGNQLA